MHAYKRYIGIVNTEGAMRLDRDEAIQHEADELAGDAFDRYEPPIEQWVRDAFVGEWGDNAESAAKHVMWAAIREPSIVWRAVEQLREAYVDHAGIHGLYAAEAEDAINCAISDEAEARRERDIDNVNLRG